MKDTAQQKAGEIKETAAQKASEWKDVASQSASNLQQKAVEAKDAAMEKGAQLTESARQTIANKFEGVDVQQKAVEAKDAVVGAVATAYESTKDTVSDAYNKMGSTSSSSSSSAQGGEPREGFATEPVASTDSVVDAALATNPENLKTGGLTPPREGFQGEIDQETIAIDAPHNNAAEAIKEKLGVQSSSTSDQKSA